MTGRLNRLRKLASQSALRKILLRPRVRRAIARVLSLRFVPAAFVVTRPFAFLYREQRRDAIRVYALRSAHGPIVIRHDSGGLELLHEVFRQQCYLPAPELISTLPDDLRVLDLGANVGAFTAFALSRWPKARVTCVEPDPDNLEALTKLVSLLPDSSVTIAEACATNEDGTVGFAAGMGEGSRIAEGAPPMRSVDALPLIAEADFVKMDIEGSEWPIMSDSRLSQAGPTVLVLEYHRRFPYDTGAADEAVSLLEAAGFEVRSVEPNYWGHGLMWAVKS